MNGYSMSDSAFCILDTAPYSILLHFDGKRSLGWDGMIGCFFRCRCWCTVWRFRCAHACYRIGVGVNHTSFVPPHTYSSSNYPNSDICFAARLDLELISIHPYICKLSLSCTAAQSTFLPRFCLALPCPVLPPMFIRPSFLQPDGIFALHIIHHIVFYLMISVPFDLRLITTLLWI